MINKIKINNFELSEVNGCYVSALKDLGYKTKYPVASVMYIHGSKIGDGYFQNRQLAFEMKIIGSSSDDLISKRSALYSALSVSEFAPDLLPIEITLSNGIVLTASAILKDLNSDINSQMVSACDISFVMETEDAFFKSLQQYQQDVPLLKGGGIAVPMVSPTLATAGATGYSNVNQGGNVFAYPELYFYGPLTNPVFTNITTGKAISLNATITAGNYYYIDTYARVVLDQTSANKRDKMTGDFLVLNVGANNFSLTTDVPAEVGFVRVIYKYYYVSI